MPFAFRDPPANPIAVSFRCRRFLASVPPRIAQPASGHDIPWKIPAAITSSDQMFGSATHAKGHAWTQPEADEFMGAGKPHGQTAIEAQSMLALKGA